MVFDVETTGLFKRGSPDPYVTQLCFLIYDVELKTVIFTFNNYIVIPKDVIISSQITQLTGITQTKCDNGISMAEALSIFHREYKLCDTIVAHNLRFDREMICTEILRNHSTLVDTFNIPDPTVIFNELYNRVHNIRLYCTMTAGKDICNLWVDSPKKIETTPTPTPTPVCRRYKKFPKLSELHNKLFGSVPEGLHDAHVDTLACLNCYLRLEKILIEL